MDLEKKWWLSWTRSQIKKRKHIWKQKNIWRIFCWDLWNWSLFLLALQANKQKKIQINENWCEYTLFRIDDYFTQYLLAMEVDEKGLTGRDLIFAHKSQKALKKKLVYKFIRISTSKEGYDADYEASKIQAFICKLKRSN